MEKRIHVIGLGPSIKNYKPDGSETIGCNDVWKQIYTDFVVCVDMPRVFTEDRLKTINTCRPKKFFAPFNEWAHHPCFQKIIFSNKGRGLKIDELLDSEMVVYSNNSSFVACVLAYKMAAKEIILHGVDFVGHKHLSQKDSLSIALRHFSDLNEAFKKRGVKLFVSSVESKLYPIIPFA